MRERENRKERRKARIIIFNVVMTTALHVSILEETIGVYLTLACTVQEMTQEDSVSSGGDLLP